MTASKTARLLELEKQIKIYRGCLERSGDDAKREKSMWMRDRLEEMEKKRDEMRKELM